MSNNSIFVMGLPEAGKTTYLAALWHVLNNGLNFRMKINKLAGDQAYLSDIGIKWVNGNKLDRTLRTAEQISLPLQLKTDNDKQIILNFPDLSGESFQNQWQHREINNKHYDIAQNAIGAFLFINPEKVKDEQLISSLGPLEFIDQSLVNTVDDGNKWSPKDAPTQVQLVELLQFLTYIRSGAPLNLIIIISAWDMVIKSENTKTIKTTTAEQWVSEKTPLLWQYLKANFEIFNVAYYGISAQGGELRDLDNLLNYEDPCKRILVVDPEGNNSNDITLPIIRILGNNE